MTQSPTAEIPLASAAQARSGWTLSLEYLEDVRTRGMEACGYDATLEFTEQVLLIGAADRLQALRAIGAGVKEQTSAIARIAEPIGAMPVEELIERLRGLKEGLGPYSVMTVDLAINVLHRLAAALVLAPVSAGQREPVAYNTVNWGDDSFTRVPVASPPSPAIREAALTGAEYEAVHVAAIEAYEAATPASYRYSATALRKAVDAALATRDALTPAQEKP